MELKPWHLAGALALSSLVSCRQDTPVAKGIEAKAPTLSQIRDHVVTEQARKWGVDTSLAIAVSHVENWSADTLARSRTGAYGIMQVMPTVWMGVFHNECGGSDLVNLEVNACYGVLILRHYLQKCHNRTACALSYYVGATDPKDGQVYIRLVSRQQRLLGSAQNE